MRRSFVSRLLGACALLLPLACGENRPPATCGIGYVADNGGLCKLTCSSANDCFPTDTCGPAHFCIPRPGDSPEITLFRVTPDTLAAGEFTTVEYVTVHADAVSIVLSGPGGDMPVATDGTSGSVRAGPITGSGQVRITASKGAAAAHDQRTITVGTPPVGVNIVSFSANPMRVVLGSSDVSLSWQISGGNNQIELYEGGNTTPLTRDGRLPSYSVRPSQTTVYTLKAYDDAGGTDMATTTVTVDPLPLDVMVNAFSIDRAEPFELGDNVALSWNTSGGQHLEIRDGSNRVIVDSNDPARIDSGVWVDLPKTTPVSYSIRVESGVRHDERTEQVDVAPAIPQPTLQNVAVTPSVLFDFSNAVTVSWNVTPSSAQVSVLLDGQPVHNTTGNGSYMAPFSSNATLHFEVVAENATGLARARVSSWATDDELEPNDFDFLATAIADRAMVNNPTAGELTEEEDWYYIHLQAGTGLDVRLEGSCGGSAGTPNVLEVLDSMNQVLLTQRVSGCPTGHVNAPQDGDYYIHLLLAPSPDRNYVLIADPSVPGCGDGMRQTGEACDDANLKWGDTCTPYCELDPAYDLHATPAGQLPTGNPLATTLPIYAIGGGLPQDRGVAAAVLPFELPYFGKKHRGLLVSVDGFVGFDPDAFPGALAPLGTPAPNSVIALFAGDLVMRDASDARPGRFGSASASVLGVPAFLISFESLHLKNRPLTNLDGGFIFLQDGRFLFAFGLLQGSAETVQLQVGFEDQKGLVFPAIADCNNSCPLSALPTNQMILISGP